MCVWPSQTFWYFTVLTALVLGHIQYEYTQIHNIILRVFARFCICVRGCAEERLAAKEKLRLQGEVAKKDQKSNAKMNGTDQKEVENLKREQKEKAERDGDEPTEDVEREQKEDVEHDEQ